MRFTQRFSRMSSDRENEEQNDKREKEEKMMKEGESERSLERDRDSSGLKHYQLDLHFLKEITVTEVSKKR